MKNRARNARNEAPRGIRWFQVGAGLSSESSPEFLSALLKGWQSFVPLFQEEVTVSERSGAAAAEQL